MGYMFCTAECVRCRALFTFNPLRVPSVVVNGTREPICKSCVEWANTERAKLGLPLFPVLPDAYEPVECD